MSPILTYRQVMTSLAPPVPADLPRTLGALRASGYSPRTVKEEIRANLVARLAAGEPTFPGLVGFDDTVIPQVERALLAGHDIVLLGERGQGKTRLIRTLVTLLDEWMPIVEGSEVNDDPLAPVSAFGRRVVEEMGDATPVTWRHRSERYGERKRDRAESVLSELSIFNLICTSLPY
jgi:magnesium chelatase subunit I